MKKLLYFFLFTLLIFACGPEKAKTDSDSQNEAAAKIVEDKLSGADGKGIGQVTSVTLESPLDQERIKRGKDIYEMKCSACHKLDEKRVVVAQRRPCFPQKKSSDKHHDGDVDVV